MFRKWLRRIGIGLGVLLLVALAVYGVLVVASQPMPEHAFFGPPAQGSVLVIAHQGGDGLRPSNTLAAFTHAAELGVDVLEMDIHSTSDGVLVVIHDDTIDRTTDGSGRVQDYTFAELQQFDAGYDWPTLAEEAGRTDRPYRGQGITIPSLEEVLQAFPDYRMNIEIKQREPSIAAPLCAMLRAYELTDQALVASFHPQSIDEFRAACPEVPTSGVEPEIRLFYVLNTLTLSAAFQPGMYAFQVPEYAGGLQVVTPGFVQGAAAHNIDVHVWTVNTPEDMQRMLDIGVQGIITDYPDRLLALLGRGG